MASVNRAMILGRLGQDPEIRYTPGGAAVCTLSLATSEVWNDRDGNRQESTEWHRVVVWGKQAENCAKFLSKGRMAFIDGRIQTRSWEDKNTGQKKYATEIVASNVQFIGGSRDNTGAPAGGFGGQPMAPQSSQGDTPSQMSSPEPSLDDIPF